MARLMWTRPRRCESNACVEVAEDGDEVLVRDGKLGRYSQTLRFTREEWAAFIGGVRHGDFDFGLVGAAMNDG